MNYYLNHLRHRSTYMIQLFIHCCSQLKLGIIASSYVNHVLFTATIINKE